jgi:hypothetical protein
MLTVLKALPGPVKEMRADDLSTIIGGETRRLLDASTDLPRNGTTYPRSLRRVPTHGFPHGWYGRTAGRLEASEKAVSPALCPHADCPETYATAIVLAPEVMTFGTSVLCRRCKRPAADTPQARHTIFPDSYVTWADNQSLRTGRWARCAAKNCRKDIGAGPGKAWRWDDTPATTQTWHDDNCRIGLAPAQHRACQFQDCTIDEGVGAGMFVIEPRRPRRWHSLECLNAELRRQTASRRVGRFLECAWTACTQDDGNGPRSIAFDGKHRTTHPNDECRTGARRERQLRAVDKT